MYIPTGEYLNIAQSKFRYLVYPTFPIKAEVPLELAFTDMGTLGYSHEVL